MISLDSALLGTFDTLEGWFQGAASEPWQLCESPIEQRMCCALFALGCKSVEGTYHPERRTAMARMINRPEAFVFAQQPVGPYRVDFLLVCIDPTARRSHTFVVECDGEEFHDADSDRERDGRLILDHHVQSVQRFSGSEINNALEDAMRRIGDILRAAGVEPTALYFPKSDIEDRRDRKRLREEMLDDEEEQRVQRYRRSLETGIWDDLPNPDFL